MRRQAWLVGFSAFVACGILSAPVCSQEATHGVRMQLIQEGLWLVESDSDWNGTTIAANALVLATSEEVLVVDTPWTDEQTRYLLDWIDSEIGLPVRYLVVTHAHGDRIGGIAEAHHRGIQTLGYRGTVELAESRGNESPEITFADTLEIDLGEEMVRLLYPGPGHASDNLVVWLENRQLLFGGCLIKSLASQGLGYTGDANLEAWPVSLARLQRLVPAPTVVVPGHGDAGGPELIEHTMHLLDQHEKTLSQ